MERDIVERLKQPMTMSMFSTIGTLAAAALTERRFAADLIESLRSELDEARKALEPFASISDLVDVETEGFEDDDTFDLMFHDYLLDRLPLHDFRRAAAIRQKGESGA